MSRWFRFYDQVLDDPKVQRLPADLFRAWVNLLCLASRNNGKLPDLPDMSFALRLSDEEVTDLVNRLADAGLLDNIDGDWAPHNWGKRQFSSDHDDTATDRKRRQRDRDAAKKVTLNVTTNVTRDASQNVTRTEQNRTEAETDQNPIDRANPQTVSGSQRKARSPDRAPDYPDEFLILWESFPRHPNASKHEACKAWRRLPPEDRDACLDGAMAYGRFLAGERTKRPDYPALHLATFINQRRFESLIEAEQCVN